MRRDRNRDAQTNQTIVHGSHQECWAETGGERGLGSKRNRLDLHGGRVLCAQYSSRGASLGLYKAGFFGTKLLIL